MKKKICAVVAGLMLLASSAMAMDVSLEWDANSENDLVGYRIFYRIDGESYDYANPSWQGTDINCMITNLDDDTKYYFVARAYDTSDNESNDSNEISFTNDTIPPEAPTGLRGLIQQIISWFNSLFGGLRIAG